MPLIFLVILTVILSILFLGHVAIYFFFLHIFSFSAPVQLWLGYLTVIMPIAFVSALVLSEWVWDNWFSRWFYRLMAGWMAFFLYLLLAAGLYSIINVFYPSITVGRICLTVGILVSLYGLFNATRIKVIRHVIKMPAIADLWLERKIIFLSDVHLGQISGVAFAKKVVDVMAKEGADLILIGGDMFDGAVGDYHALVKPFSTLYPELGKFFVMGNHEEFEDNTKFKNALTAQGVRVLEDEVVTIDGLQIVGMDYKTTTSRNDFRAKLQPLEIDRLLPSILIKHVPQHLEIASEKGITLSLHGHTHRAQAWPLNIITHFIFKGFDYGLRDLGGMSVYTSSGVGTWGPPLKVGSKAEIVVFKLSQ